LKNLLIAGAAAVLAAAGAVAADDRLERGEYLVRVVAACGNCHTPITPEGHDPTRELAGGFVEETPAFTAYAPNITPDPDTGIGRWSDAEIRRAIREGLRPDGSVIGPPMPIVLYRGLSDADLDAMVAFLRTVAPVRNEVPRSEYRMPLPPAWGPPVEFVPDIPRGATADYGAYLAGPVAHCMECHTTFGPTGPMYETHWGAGGAEFNGPWGASVSANLTPHADGIAAYTDAELADMIRKGVRPDGSRMAPPMGYPFYARMAGEDVGAIIAYLRTLPPLPDPH
jgi:mono/diheme cytochrome c family protein